jgi:hypothetical protein
MSTKYVIRWKSKVNGRAGRGTKEFNREHGEQLVAELNSEYPDIEHELIVPPPPQPHEDDASQTGGQPQSETHDQPSRNPLHAMS